MSIEMLARPEIRGLRPYVTARQESGTIRLNANETPWAIGSSGGAVPLNRYPEIRPLRLQSALARHYGVAPDQLLVTRGSSEAIDLLIRAFCRAGLDNVVVTPPTFSMYRVYADIQGAAVISVPLRAENDFAVDVRAISAACTANTKLIFLCSPNNPTGNLVPPSQIIELAEARRDQSLIVVDEAYVEFSGAESLVNLLGRYDNLVVLRTLSKALGLAGARCGAILCSAKVVNLLDGILAPYALATPVIDCVLDALTPAGQRNARESIERIVVERERLARELERNPRVVKVWPSRANFLLVRFRGADGVRAVLQADRILVREFPGDTALADCARVTAGTRAENERLLAALTTVEERA